MTQVGGLKYSPLGYGTVELDTANLFLFFLKKIMSYVWVSLPNANETYQVLSPLVLFDISTQLRQGSLNRITFRE